MAKLVFIGDHFAGRTVELSTGRTMVGRGQWNGVVIADKSVSNYHCDLLVHGTEVIVREKGSTNGTWVDDQRVTGQLPVKPGQLIRFGSACAQLVFDGGERSDGEFEPETAHDEYRRILRERQAAASQQATPRAMTTPDMDQTMPTACGPLRPLPHGTAPARAQGQTPKPSVLQRGGLAPIVVGMLALALARFGAWLAAGR